MNCRRAPWFSSIGGGGRDDLELNSAAVNVLEGRSLDSTTGEGNFDDEHQPWSARDREPPKRLYKYRGFSARTVDCLLSDEVIYAAPESFNDALDTKPSLHADSSIEELKAVLMRLVRQRVQAEMQAARENNQLSRTQDVRTHKKPQLAMSAEEA